MKNKILPLLFFLMASLLSSQDLLPEIKKNGISLGVLGTATYSGISYDRILNENVRFEIGLGVLGIGGGISYHLNQIDHKNPSYYTGVKITYNTMILDESRFIIYAPIGIFIPVKSNFFISADIGPALFRYLDDNILSIFEDPDKYPYNEFGIYGGINIGWRF